MRGLSGTIVATKPYLGAFALTSTTRHKVEILRHEVESGPLRQKGVRSKKAEHGYQSTLRHMVKSYQHTVLKESVESTSRNPTTFIRNLHGILLASQMFGRIAA